MSLFEKLKNDLYDNRKSMAVEATTQKATRVSILRLLVSEFEDRGTEKPVRTDEAIFKKIREFMESNKLMMQKNVNDSEKYIKADMENVILETYLPTQLSEDEMKAEMLTIVQEKNLSGMKDMKVVKEEMDTRFPNQFNKKLLGKIGKEVLE